MPEATIITPDPSNFDQVSTSPPPSQFGSDEVLWFVNGRWTALGYGLPNTGGKNDCVNPFVWEFVNSLGAELFELTHREQRKFRTALDIGLVTEVINLVQVARKRIADNALLPNDPFDRALHDNPTRKEFVIYPIPYFDPAIRSADMRIVAQWGIQCLSEAIQHTEADRSIDVTAKGFGAAVGMPLQRILIYFATKYLGFSRADAIKPDFTVQPADYKNFSNQAFLFSTETTDERQDEYWQPTENDLRQLRGMRASVAMSFGRRYPTGEKVFLGGPDPVISTGAADKDPAVTSINQPQFFSNVVQPVQMPGAGVIVPK